MKIKAFVSTIVLVAAVFASPVLAQETHTITPHFPDHFKVRSTQVADQSQETNSPAMPAGLTQKTRTTVTVLSETHKTDTGYHATYSLDAMDIQSDGAGAQAGQAEKLSEMAKLMKSVGPAEVTLDNNLMPVRVDNIEDIKAKAKAALTTSPEFKENNVGQLLYNMMLANLTPESAASFLKQGKQQSSYFNRPLTIGQPIPIGGEPIAIMGGNFKMGGTMTLTGWEEGKAAHLTYVMTPNEEDIRSFLRDMMKTMVSAMMPTLQETTKDPKATQVVQDMLDRMVDNMKMTMKMSCTVDLSLVNYIDTHTSCDTDTLMDMDMKKIMPESLLKENPAMKDSLPTVQMRQATHQVSDAVLIN